jgi:hypothetical protein
MLIVFLSPVNETCVVIKEFLSAGIASRVEFFVELIFFLFAVQGSIYIRSKR